MAPGPYSCTLPLRSSRAFGSHGILDVTDCDGREVEVIKVLPSPLTAIEAMTEPTELARAHAYKDAFNRNWTWLQDHATEIYTQHRGKYVVIASAQCFVGDTADESWRYVADAGIEDEGSFVMRVPKQGAGVRQTVPVMMVTDVTDPDELAAANLRRARSDRNATWMQEHAGELFALYRGKCICIAGQQAFAADTSREAVALAKAAHPEDDGRLIYRVPKHRATRVYAY